MIALTQREEQCLDLLCQGYMPKEVAEILGISLRTAEKHLAGARTAFAARTTIQACVLFTLQNREQDQ